MEDILLTPDSRVCKEVPKSYPKCCEESYRIGYHIGHEDGCKAQLAKPAPTKEN